MIHPCDKLCGNKTASGYCATTVCINPQYSNIGTAKYGQGVQKPLTNSDRIRAMTDEELAEFIANAVDCCNCKHPRNGCSENDETCADCWLDWLKEEAKDGSDNW